MFTVLNRMAWILALSIWIWICSLDNDLILLWLVSIFTIKFILSENFIKSHILEYNKRLEESILSQVWQWQISTPQKNTQIKETKIQNEAIHTEDINDYVWADFSQEQKEIEKINEENKKSFNENKPILQERIYEAEIPEKIPEEPSKIAQFLSDFFAENLMSKIGWILLALWIIFLMSLVYTSVWPVLKIIIWFAVWFTIYFIGTILHKKWFETEWFILLGTGILINYIVILSGKFIIWDNTDWFLSSWITFIFLILNTAFSVLTSYIYNSKNLLLFSLVFAFIIPFLTGNTDTTPYMQVWYWLIISLWGLVISNYIYKSNDNSSSLQLFFISLIGWNILFLTAPFSNESNYFVIKMIWFNILTFISIFLAYKNKFTEYILPTFSISFVFLALIMFAWSALSSVWILIVFIIGTLWLLIGTSFFIVAWIGSWLMYVLFVPILFVLWFISIGWAGSALILLPLFLISYLCIFAFWIGTLLSSTLKYVFFWIIWIFLVIWNINISLNLGLTFPILFIMWITSFLFIISTYYLSSKKDLSYLYTIWTLAGIFILLPILRVTGEFTQISIWMIVLFGILNYITPFINSNLVKNDSKNLVLWNIFGILFIWGNVFRFGNEYFPGVTLWIWFFALAVLYFIWWFILFSKFEKEESSNKEANLNFIYTFLAIAISLFSIAVALVFSKLPLVISFIWLVESSIVVYFANKLNSKKVFTAGIILFIIWLVKYVDGITVWLHFTDLVVLAMILISLFLNVIFIKNSDFGSKNIIKILHLIWIILVYGSLLDIFDDHSNSGKIFPFTWVYLWTILIAYNILKDVFLKRAAILFFSLLFVIHIGTTGEINHYYYNYLLTVIAGVIVVWEYVFFKDKTSKTLAMSYGMYFFFITSIYLYHTTHDAFSLTIYWWILSLVWVHLWIWKWNKYLRATGLYLLIITLLKISLYDIWNNLDNPIMRVIALMFVWWIMMYISTLYSKNKLSIKDDFHFSSSESSEEKIPEIESKSEKKSEISINEDIKNVDVSDIESVKFNGNNKKNFSIKSKNLFKIVVLITTNSEKTSFEAGELQEIYDNVVRNYKSELSEADYKKVLWVIKDFVEVGGSVEINKK